MYRIITVEREYGCGAGEIARQLSLKLGWKLWDRELTAEIARVANVDAVPRAIELLGWQTVALAGQRAFVSCHSVLVLAAPVVDAVLAPPARCGTSEA